MIKDEQKEIDRYIVGYPEDIQKLLKQIRTVIKTTAPKADEKLNYGIPTFTLNGNLVHFGAYKNHIGFYPAPSGIKAFNKGLSIYKGAKDSVQFPFNEPLPLKLIEQIVKFRVKENLLKANRAKKK